MKIFFNLIQFSIIFCLVESQQPIEGQCFQSNSSYSFQRGYILNGDCYQISKTKGNVLVFNKTEFEESYPIFWSSNGLQSVYTFSLYLLDDQYNFTIKIYQVLIEFVQKEYQIKAKEIKHSSCSMRDIYYFYFIDLNDQWNFLQISIEQTLIYKLPVIPTIIKANIYVFNQCIYQIVAENLSLQLKQIHCLENIKNIQYYGDKNLVVETDQYIYAFHQNVILQKLPQTSLFLFVGIQYIFYYDKNKDFTLIKDLSEFMEDKNIQFNLNFLINPYYFILSRQDSTSENQQSTNIVYQIRTIPYNDIQFNFIKEKTNTTQIYLVADPANNSLYLESINDEDNEFDYNQFDPFAGDLEILSTNQSLIGFYQISIYLNALLISISLITFLIIIKRKAKRRHIKALIKNHLISTQFQITKQQFQQKYQINYDESLGIGSYGQVFKARNKYKDIIKNPSILKKMPESFACKEILVQNGQEEHQNQVMNEIKVLERLTKYNSINKLVNYCIQEKQTLIVLELAEKSLQDLIREKQINYGKFCEKEIISFLSQIAKTLAEIYLQEKISHENLKPNNILINQDRYFLSDFGSANHILQYQQSKREILGTNIWMSPEALESNFDENFDWFKSDMFSLGLILLYMITLTDISQINQNIFLRFKRLEVLRQQRKDLHENIILLVIRMLSYDPQKRPDPSIINKTIEDLERYSSQKEKQLKKKGKKKLKK